MAAAIAARRVRKLGPLPQAAGFTALPGLGARGMVDDRDVAVGRARLCADRGMTVPAGGGRGMPPVGAGRAARSVLAGWDGQVRGAFAVADTIKPSAAGRSRSLPAWACVPCC